MSYQPGPIGSVKEMMLGRLDYYLKPSLKTKQGGPFNGQEFRSKIFNELVDRMNFSLIVETGTFRGVTTKYMCRKSGLPVYTAEVNPRFYSFACTRLRKDQNAHLYNMDSREFLEKLVRDGLLEGNDALFYLDAHWGEDLPLLDELRIIFEKSPAAVVMIDDFKVPGDADYGYDDYGAGKSLSLEYIEPAVQKYGLTAFFPARPADAETGVKRGCVVLAMTSEKVSQLGQLDTLVIHSPPVGS